MRNNNNLPRRLLGILLAICVFVLPMPVFADTVSDSGEFKFTCQSEPSGGTVSYKLNNAGEFITLDFGGNKSTSIPLTDSDTSITIKIEPDKENGYLLDADRGVTLFVNNDEKYKASGESIADFVTGHTFDLSGYIGSSKISENAFELEFEIKNQNGGASGYRPYESKYSGAKVENIPLTVTGNVDFCINDSELFNVTTDKTLNLTGDYTYSDNGYVDFYVQWRLDNRYTSIVINGTDYYSQLPTPATAEGRQALLDACKGQFNEYKLTVPYSESGYTVSGAVKELDESDKDYWQVGNFLWFYKETSGADEDDLILNGKMELIGITLNGSPFTPTEIFSWENDDNGGSAVLPAGAEITVKIIPEYGYQLTSFGVNGFGFGTGVEQSVFTFKVEQGNFHLGASITKVEDEVKSSSDDVTSGNITLGSNEISTGSVVLSVETASDNNKSGFESELTNHAELSGYKIDSILDINLNQVLYKGNTTDFWEKSLNSLKSAAEIALNLAGDFKDVVVLHQNHDGTFEKLPTTFENGKITFSTNEFSDFALAVEELNTNSGCLSVGFDNRGDENSKVMVKTGEYEYSANPWVWSEYSGGDSEIKFTVTVPGDRKGHTPIVEAEVKDKPDTKKSVTVTKNGDTYTFSITPNTLFPGEENPSFMVFVNWTEFDNLYPNEGQFMVHANAVCNGSGNGTISVLGAMNTVGTASLGSEKKYLYAKPSSASDLHVIFKPDNGKVLYGFAVDRGEDNITEYGFENGLPLPEPQSDGSYDFTLLVSGSEPVIYIEAVFGDGDKFEQVAKPVISPDGGAFTGSQTVTITCATEGATIYYTTDGSVPTAGSTKYTGAFTITFAATVKAIALKPGADDSEIAAATFTKKSSGGTPTTPTKPTYPTYPVIPTPPTTPTTPTTHTTPKEPKIEGENVKSGWGAIEEELKDIEEGDKVVINMNGASKLPEGVLDAMKGKDIDIVLDMGKGIKWTINGEDIENPEAIDLSVSDNTKIPSKTIKKLVGKKDYVPLSLKHNGDFGFKATLTVNIDKNKKNQYANLYYYNEKTKKTELVSSSKIDKNGNSRFPLTHASDYIIVIDKVSHAKPQPKAASTKNSVTIKWATVPGAEKYAVYKYVNGKAVKVKETEKRAFKFTKLKSGKKYSYIVRAYVDGKWTTMKKSDIVTVTTKKK